MSAAYPEPAVRRLITASVMAASMMNSLDSTIANVALPHIQGSMSASAEEMTWVLTSYIIASAIATPLSGWVAGRLGRRRLMLWSILGFTCLSGLCGFATNLDELVFFRVLQGVFGAALIPVSQAILLDINPPERHGPAMSIWGMGAILGPIIGPALGGWLTDNLDWRWVFFINLPIGALAFAGLSMSLAESGRTEHRQLDFLGFGMLAMAIGSFQLMLDRGTTQDWFNSLEIRIEAACGVFFLYLFVVHTLTAKRPFIDLALFKDRNFLFGSILGFFLGIAIFAVLALLPPMLENLMGYPVVLTGLVTAPRGIGTLFSMLCVGQLIKRVDPRLLILFGFLLAGYSNHWMAGFSLEMNSWEIIASGFVQGIGTGFVFVSLSIVVFATLPVRYRNEGTAMFTLIRNIGSAAGISILQAITVQNSARVHARLVEGVRPDNPVLQQAAPDFDFTAPSAVARMSAEVSRQAAMVAYVDAFWLLAVLCAAVVPLLLLIRRPRSAPAAGAAVHAE